MCSTASGMCHRLLHPCSASQCSFLVPGLPHSCPRAQLRRKSLSQSDCLEAQAAEDAVLSAVARDIAGQGRPSAAGWQTAADALAAGAAAGSIVAAKAAFTQVPVHFACANARRRTCLLQGLACCCSVGRAALGRCL